MDTLKRQLKKGIVAFPATPFTAGNELDVDRFESHLAHLLSFNPCAIVPAGGAGELFSLSMAEHAMLCKIAQQQQSKVPIIIGVGQGVAMAIEMARTAESNGAAGVLLFPPYLVASEQRGLAEYVKAVCSAVSIGVIAYSRNNGIFSANTVVDLIESCPNFIGLKDGVGDFESLVTLQQAVGDKIVLLNGVPTAEIIASQCFSMGIKSYSSAVFTFLPALANCYFQAVDTNNTTLLNRLLNDFYVPLCALRNKGRGYAVSIVKAGLNVVGQPAGSVRAPLVDLSPAEQQQLHNLIDQVADLTDVIIEKP